MPKGYPNTSSKIFVLCGICKKQLSRWPFEIKERSKFFCSPKHRGMGIILRGKDNPNWREDSKVERTCKHCHKTFSRYFCQLKNKNIGESYCSKHCMTTHLINPVTYNYKGGGYSSVHKWIVKKYGSAKSCWHVFCKKISKRYEWANLDENYSRDIYTWAQLCKSCHFTFDMNDTWRKNCSLGKLKRQAN